MEGIFAIYAGVLERIITVLEFMRGSIHLWLSHVRFAIRSFRIEINVWSMKESIRVKNLTHVRDAGRSFLNADSLVRVPFSFFVVSLALQSRMLNSLATHRRNIHCKRIHGE